MKKEITYKVGDKFIVIEDSWHVFNPGEIVTLIDDEDDCVPLFRNEKGVEDYLKDTEVKPLIKKVKPKKEKPQKETYHILNISKKMNGWSVIAERDWLTPDKREFVFITKARLIKWIESNI